MKRGGELKRRKGLGRARPEPRRKPLARGKRLKPVNASRRKKEFARCYHSRARVEFVKSLPCSACGAVGRTENAHVTDDGTKGAGRKAGYQCIAPLCGCRVGLIGCHSFLHNGGLEILTVIGGWDPEKAAERTESAWLAHLAATEGRGERARRAGTSPETPDVREGQ